MVRGANRDSSWQMVRMMPKKKLHYHEFKPRRCRWARSISRLGMLPLNHDNVAPSSLIDADRNSGAQNTGAGQHHLRGLPHPCIGSVESATGSLPESPIPPLDQRTIFREGTLQGRRNFRSSTQTVCLSKTGRNLAAQHSVLRSWL